ncbi:MAG TPA: hypothetical protein VIL29_12560 [Pseudothermotoga sp.]
MPRDAVYEGVLVTAGEVIFLKDIPVCLEHDITKVIGKVLDVYEKEDGYYFVAEVDEEVWQKYFACAEETCALAGASVGGRFAKSEDKSVLIVYEISLTKTPYFETLGMDSIEAKSNENNNQKIINGMEEQLQQLSEQIAALTQQMQELATQMTDVLQRLDALEEKASATEAEVAEASQKAEQALTASNYIKESADRAMATAINEVRAVLEPLVKSIVK